ncbi:MAG: YWFCY domain-containing protein, partial [Chitinophagaceae bacterium]
MQTGENEQGLRKILDMTRLISLVILIIHFYYFCYTAFHKWGLTSGISDRLLQNIQSAGLFTHFHKSKIIALGFLAISLLGAKGRKDQKLHYQTAFGYLITGLLIYFCSYLSLSLTLTGTQGALVYISITSTGYLLMLSGGTLLSRIIRSAL